MYRYESRAELMASMVDLNRQFYVDPGRRQEFVRCLEERGSISGFESEVYCKDGSTIWVSENARAVRDVAGNLLYYEGTTVDITDRKQTEQALRASEERYRGLFEDSPIALWEEDFSLVKQRLDALREQGIADIPAYLMNHPEVVAECAAQIRIIDVNAGALKLYHGGSKEQLISTFAKIISAKAGSGFVNELANIAQGLTDFQLESLDRTLTGDTINVSLRWSVLPGYEHTLRRVIISAINITERVRAEALLQQRLAELEAVNRLSTALRAAQTLDKMLPQLLGEALDILNGSAGSIWLYDPPSDEVRLVCERGWGRTVSPFKRGEGIPGYVVATGQAYLSRELKNDPRMPDAVRGNIPAGVGGLCVPIRAADEITGVLYLNADLPHEFSPADVHLLTTLAEIAGSAIHRMRLYEQTEQQLNRMTALRSVDQAISSSLDLRVTLSVLLDQATAQLSADAADVLLLNPHRQILEYGAGRGYRGAEVERLRLRLGEGRAGRAAYDRRLVHVANLRQESGPDPAAALAAAEGFVAYYGVPLLAKGQIKGVLEIYHRRPLEAGQDWLDFLEALAGQAAIAIDNAGLFDGLQRSNLELTLAYDATIAGWSRALDMRDHETGGHAQRVTDMAVQMAATLGVPETEWVHVRRGALLHDVGKMGVPTNILLKPGPLSDEEWANMRQHPEHAVELLSPSAFLRPALDIPYSHHEKWDGSGYPRQLKGEQIPLSARIFAVVDVWDALLSDRPYRAAWPRERALAYIREQAGRHFDPRVVGAFLRLFEQPETGETTPGR